MLGVSFLGFRSSISNERWRTNGIGDEWTCGRAHRHRARSVESERKVSDQLINEHLIELEMRRENLEQMKSIGEWRRFSSSFSLVIVIGSNILHGANENLAKIKIWTGKSRTRRRKEKTEEKREAEKKKERMIVCASCRRELKTRKNLVSCLRVVLHNHSSSSSSSSSVAGASPRSAERKSQGRDDVHSSLDCHFLPRGH